MVFQCQTTTEICRILINCTQQVTQAYFHCAPSSRKWYDKSTSKSSSFLMDKCFFLGISVSGIHWFHNCFSWPLTRETGSVLINVSIGGDAISFQTRNEGISEGRMKVDAQPPTLLKLHWIVCMFIVWERSVWSCLYITSLAFYVLNE